MTDIIKKSCINCKYCNKIETPLKYEASSEDIIGGTIFKCKLKDSYIHNSVRNHKCRYYHMLEGYNYIKKDNILVKALKNIFRKEAR